MAGPNFQFNPLEGFLNKDSFPDPSTETEARTQVQSLLNQLRDIINTCATIADIQGVILGQIADGSITIPKLSFDPATKDELNSALATLIPLSQKGTANGVASLGSDGTLDQKPFITGSYTGDGTSSRSIILNVSPKAVFVCRNNGLTNAGGSVYGGLASNNNPLKSTTYTALIISTNGFNVFYDSTNNIYTNQSGSVYNYIAFI